MTSCIFHDTTPATQERQLFEIVERAYAKRQKVLVFTSNGERAANLDRVLWILKQEAFIPHRIFKANEADPDVPVAIVVSEENPNNAETLVADGHCSLDFACGFQSIHEFVNRSNPQVQQDCRDRFRDYKARQIPVEYSK